MSRPLLLGLALALGCAMRAPDRASEPSHEPASAATSGADEAAPSTWSEDRVEAEAPEGTPPPSAPAVAGAARAPQAAAVEAVEFGQATDRSMVSDTSVASATISGNASAGRAWARLVDSEDALHDALGLASVDCGDARDLRDRICELGERICDLADDLDDDVTADRCEDGRHRCEHARQRVADRCE